MRLLAPVLVLVLWAFLAPLVTPTNAASSADCRFLFGFRTLHHRLPAIVGNCVGGETHNPTNGNGLQTTTHGLLVWRKADNFTAFTDGTRTWINGPFGIQTRANAQRFCWEIDAGEGCLAPISSLCRSGDPLANVHNPLRLQVIERCATATGTVDAVDDELDGDVFITLRRAAGQENLVNGGNELSFAGDLVAEVVPADQPGCVPGRPPRPPLRHATFGICTGANLATPSVGQRVTVVGPHVLDKDHGWLEIHPVWAIEFLSSRAPR